MVHVQMLLFTVIMSFLTSTAFYYEMNICAVLFIIAYFLWVIGLAWEKSMEEKEGGQ